MHVYELINITRQGKIVNHRYMMKQKKTSNQVQVKKKIADNFRNIHEIIIRRLLQKI